MTVIRPVARAWAFSHEVLCGKWVMSGLYIGQLPRLLYVVFEYYLLLNLALFQMLIVASPEPHKTINEVMLMFQADSWLKTLHN